MHLNEYSIERKKPSEEIQLLEQEKWNTRIFILVVFVEGAKKNRPSIKRMF